MTYIVFTDLDGTLLNSDDYRFDGALGAIAALQARHIPVIPVTSKTRAEVEWLREQMQLTDPFVVENGSGAFVRDGDDRFDTHNFDTHNTEAWGDYRLRRLGCTYDEARAGLRAVSDKLNTTLRGFGDLSAAEVAERTGLSAAEVERAQSREFTEPFVTPTDCSASDVAAAVAAAGFRVTVGDRFSHLIGASAGKGKAVRWLVEAWRSAAVQTIGLGNSPNDLEMLLAVDRPIVLPNPQGCVHPGLVDRGFAVAPAAGCRGWAQAIGQILDEAPLES